MEVLIRRTSQPRAYADSVGYMLVRLEDTENKEEVISKIMAENVKSGGWSTNSFLKEVDRYVINENTKFEKVYTGRLLLFSAFDRYTG